MFKSIRHKVGRLVDVCVLPLIPQSYRLAIQYHKYVFILGREPEIKQIKHYARKSTLAIDVGANMGLWSYAMVKSCMFKKVLAIEPNSRLTSNLKTSGFDNVTVLHKAVSSRTGKCQLKIPTIGKTVYSGWASLENNIDIDADITKEIEVETVRLDDIALEDVGFIKVDVEGHEIHLLDGARNFFIRNRPVCLIECRDRNRCKVEDYFFGLQSGYNLVDTNARYGFDLSPQNMLFSCCNDTHSL